MASDFYNGEDGGAAVAEPVPEPPMAEEATEEVVEETPVDESESAIEILPKSFFLGKEKPGYRCEIEVVKVEEDSVLVKKIAHKDATEEGDDAMDEEPKGETFYD